MSPLPDDERLLFWQEVGDCRPMRCDHVPLRRNKPQPHAHQSRQDESRVMQDALSDEQFDELHYEHVAYLKNGVSAHTLKKMRTGHWAVEAKLDLHGMDRDRARCAINQFIPECTALKKRCVRVIHGKGLGSEHGVPVLKKLVPIWLRQKKEVLAFAPARPMDGGDGALLVLLKY
jgi:DNA-nicking Smr family endonuclease